MNIFLHIKIMAGLDATEGENITNNTHNDAQKIQNDTFYEWIQKKYGFADFVITNELIEEYEFEKQCLLSNSQYSCNILKEQTTDWKFEKISLKEKSLSKRIYNVWKNRGTLKYVTTDDIKTVIEGVLKDMIKDFNPIDIANDLLEIDELFNKKEFKKLTDKLVTFIAKRFPVFKPAIIALRIADKLVDKGIKRKNSKHREKSKKNNEKRRQRISILLPQGSIDHIFHGDNDGGSHFFTKQSYFTFSGIKKIHNGVWIGKIYKGDIVYSHKTTRFPEKWGINELMGMRKFIARKKGEYILRRQSQGTINIPFNYKGIEVMAIVKRTDKRVRSRKTKKGNLQFKLITLYPNY